MAIKRSEQIDSENAGYYHLISRCVRRTFLCGFDDETGNSYEHRREWIEKRILKLAEVFSIEVYSYAVMHNHYHLVVYSDPVKPKTWSDKEVANRWLMLYPGNGNKNNFLQRKLKLKAILGDKELLNVYRERLGSISWLMKCINEPIAKKSNREDFVKGHFWESRFTSQALLDETAAITCMAYVDLNPIRANMCQSLEESEYTSIQTRLVNLNRKQLNEAVESIAGSIKDRKLNINLMEYIKLLDWTGKALVYPDKKSIPADLLPLFQRIGVQQENWLTQINNIDSNYFRVIGSFNKIQRFTSRLKQQWMKGISSVKDLYLPAS